MKRQKNGFTLAEVLITLGIIGVIAAIMLPAIVGNTRKQTMGSEVGRAKELLEHATANVILSANKNNGDGHIFTTISGLKKKDVIGGNSDDWLITKDETASENWINTTLSITGLKDFRVQESYLNSIKMYSGDDTLSSVIESISEFPTYRFDKLGTIIIYEPIGDIDLSTAGENSVITRVLFDINGEEEPNRIGQDIFLFGIANNGHILPAGSEAYNFGDYVDDVTVGACVDDNVGDGLACAARVAADGWKIKY